MSLRDVFRFWFPIVGLVGLAGYSGTKMVRTHLDSEDVDTPRYDYERTLYPVRGAIYAANGYPLVKGTPTWEYRLDPVSMTNVVVRVKGEEPRTVPAMARTIANVLKLDYAKTLAMCQDTSRRYQYLGTTGDIRAHGILTNRHYVAGIIAKETYERHYFEGTRLAHVIGSVNAENNGSCGLELKYNSDLRGMTGLEKGKLDGQRRPILDKQVQFTPAVPGADLHLTIDHRLQREAEAALADGIKEYGAASGWCVILDAKTGEVLSLASSPTFDPQAFGKLPARVDPVSDPKVNRVTSFTYEPGSVMKVITAASAIDVGLVRPDSLYSTDRYDDRYYKLPGDGSHKWEPKMTVKDAIVHSSNIVIGKLGCDFGPKRLYAYMRKFGFGQRTGIELPGEEVGILRDPNKKMWDKATWSRAAIGQGVSVTALQMASAYQAIANDGVRHPPRIVKEFLDAKGNDILSPASRPDPTGVRVLKASTARQVREMMLGVAGPGGTARRAAVKGYSVAGKTGTAQKVKNGKYAPGLYRATFCGIVPSGVVKREPTDAEPVPPRVVILVSLDFEKNTRYHQGGNSSGPIFRKIALGAMRCLEVPPDRPNEVDDFDDDEFDKLVFARTRRAAEDDPEWDGDTEWMQKP